jgi:hypothetical protein
MKQNPPNARFWVYLNGSPVKLTLRPGAELHHYWGEPNDEGGWSSAAHRWEYVVNDPDFPPHVLRECTIDGRDCDGRLTQHYDSVCSVEDLAAHVVEGAEYKDFHDGREICYPKWERTTAWNRDEFAEAMGY